jgi:protein kinase-like protein
VAGEPAARHPKLPEHLGKYRIEALLGRGGMGEVYKAYDPSLDRVVALKTIRPEVQDEELLGRFKREGRAAGRLRHPRIVTVYDLGEADGVAFMAMEYLEGRSLAAEIRDGKLTFDARVRVLLQTLDGLAYAHEHGVIHRDVKPANIQVLPDATVKILDFGVARLAAAESLSHTGTVVGTVLYMAPEQLRGEKVDGRADVYSAGVVAYELFAERRPFEGQTLTEIVLKVINEPPPPMNSRWLAGYPQIEEVVCRAIAKDPADRYGTAAAMAAAMEETVRALAPAIATTAPGAMAGAESATEIVARPSATPQSPMPATSMPTDRHAPAAETGGRRLTRPPRIAPLSSTLAPGVVPALVRTWQGGRWARVARVGLSAVAASVLGLIVARMIRESATVSTGSPMAVVAPVAPLVEREPSRTPPPPETRPAGPSLPATDIAVVPPSVAAAPRSPLVATHGIAVVGKKQLVAAVAGALRARGCALVDAPSHATFVLSVNWDVELRPAPLGTGPAKTADYTATADVRGPKTAVIHREFDGHVMEVGENVTLAAARRMVAGQIADEFTPLLAPCRP